MATPAALETAVTDYDAFREAARRLLQTAERTLETRVAYSIEIVGTPSTPAGLALRDAFLKMECACEDLHALLYGNLKLEPKDCVIVAVIVVSRPPTRLKQC